MLILADYEARSLLPELWDIPISFSRADSVITGGASVGLPGHSCPPVDPALLSRKSGPRFDVCAPVSPTEQLSAVFARVAADGELLKESSQAYGASLGFYNGHLRKFGWDKPDLVKQMNELWLTLGCPEVPIMPVDTLGKM